MDGHHPGPGPPLEGRALSLGAGGLGWGLWIVLAGGAWVLARVLARPLLLWCRRRHIGVTNYRGAWVPWGLGLAWILAAGGGVAAGAALAGAAARAARGVGEAGLGEPGRLAVLAAWLFWAGLVGWVDDLLGDGSRRGLRGHGGALLQGELTTGALKLLLLGSGALLVGLAAPPKGLPQGWGWLAGATLVALTVNTVNLLDLRPGRAFKGSLVLLGVAFLADGGASLPALPGLAAALALMGWDLREEGVLGDAGANALGALAGWSLVAALPPAGILGALVGLAWLHLEAEHRSLSRRIAGSSFLNWLDHLGRLEPEPRGEGGSTAN